MIVLKGLCKCFGKKIVYENVNLTFEAGSSYALVGVSGSGKTTLLNAIARLEKPTSGEILVASKPIWQMKEKQYFKDYLGYVFQSYALIDDKNVAQNLKIIEKDSAKQIIALEQVGLDETYLTSRVYELSGGQAQRVAIARMLLKKFKLILADEPTGALDDDTGEQVGELLLSLVTADTTLIVATHDLALANQMDHIIYMKDLVN
ncbi:ABC transporter ATP-binding protein [Lactococcus piscium]|uniref:Peptide ABC transporter ATP-binding protein n=1 Tax=Pseudolactococcus paracarnosus TaxID=2749962 RepID=A0A7L4WDN0_9LACT|nr:ABC transporter ATP-binding protein [Lactococcus paracarnosus]MCJ1994590.1 ABC transporter ATP-binding protein [Lactococcus paracarnosus]QDJ28287.1 peptide ABC transporter ATP-binding protein [Lactococcus paracarnosus]SPC35307.1 ABC transporter ATP-binding protein [Lactococcus piscium]